MNFLVEGIRQAMELLYRLTGDYGIAIVCMTAVIRVCMLLLGRQQRKYMENKQQFKGCLVSLLQFPVMLCLYRGICLTAAAGTATVLLPWVSSLLVGDPMHILPIATVLVQMLPQVYPYVPCFKALCLQKPSVPMVLSLLLANSLFAFMIPSGVGLYYFVSGLFGAGEQFAVHCAAARRAAAA